jgi:hypothetical protein
MSLEYEKQLEAQLDRELKQLPDLQAPRSLALRVMAAVKLRASVPWYHQSWPAWPVAIRVMALVVSLALFGVLCFAAWQVSQLPVFASCTRSLDSMMSGLNAVWNTINVLLEAVVLAVKHLGTWFMLGLLTMAALAYGVCLGLGSVYLKLAFARR